MGHFVVIVYFVIILQLYEAALWKEDLKALRSELKKQNPPKYRAAFANDLKAYLKYKNGPLEMCCKLFCVFLAHRVPWGRDRGQNFVS